MVQIWVKSDCVVDEESNVLTTDAYVVEQAKKGIATEYLKAILLVEGLTSNLDEEIKIEFGYINNGAY